MRIHMDEESQVLIAILETLGGKKQSPEDEIETSMTGCLYLFFLKGCVSNDIDRDKTTDLICF